MIYLVEDDENIRELVVYSLSVAGLDTRGFAIPSDFYSALDETLPELILLDIMLPGEDGLSILRRLRGDRRTEDIPVIMLTAKNSEMDKVRCFNQGADDYITKPFGIMELNARVKARLKNRTRQTESEYRIGELYVCPSRHLVQCGGECVALTLKEFEMLCYLLENRGIVLTRDRILNHIWGYSFDGENRTVDVHIRTLRQKLSYCGELIETVRGIGYKIQ